MRIFDNDGRQLVSLRRLPYGWSLTPGDERTTIEKVWEIARDSTIGVACAALAIAIAVALWN